MLNEQTIALIKDIAFKVKDMTEYNANRYSAEGIPEFYATEIIDLIILKTDNAFMQRQVAKEVLKNSFPLGTSYFVKRYFDLRY